MTVFDAPVYDALFEDMVRRNVEGDVVLTGAVDRTPFIPFTAHVVRELLGGGRLAPAAAGCLELAWEHRRSLLNG